jgi:coenzyme F420-reducing hydrogenase gamma subunit
MASKFDRVVAVLQAIEAPIPGCPYQQELLEAVEALTAHEELVGTIDELVALVENDDEATQPGTDLYKAVADAKRLTADLA